MSSTLPAQDGAFSPNENFKNGDSDVDGFLLSFPILNGPSLMELMLAQYDPYPFGLEQSTDRREIELTLAPEAAKSEIDATEITVRVLGARHKKLADPVWLIEGIFCDYRDVSYRKVLARFNVATRKGRIRIGRIDDRLGL